MKNIIKFVKSHGFDCYVSTDNEVVIRIPVWHAKYYMLSFEVVGVRTLAEAREAIGY